MSKSKKNPSSADEKIFLPAVKRDIFGKKLKRLRREGFIPANIYGHSYKSKAISVIFKDFVKVYKKAKETSVIYLKLASEEIPVLIKNVQRHPVNDIILHVDFRKIDLKQKITTEVPIKVVGQSEAITQKGGILLNLVKTLTIEAFPQDIPSEIEINITQLKDIGQEIKVANLPKSEKYQIKDELNKVIVSITQHKEESITPETTPAAAPEVITEAKPKEQPAPPPPEEKKPLAEKKATPSSPKAKVEQK